MKSKRNDRDYVRVIYNDQTRPLTEYPEKLTSYLWTRYNLNKGCRLLDIGCGRGEFTKGFINAGAEGYAVDQSYAILDYCADAFFKEVNLETDQIPYQDNFFDVVYSKSVIEHFYYPEKFFAEAFRVLKPGGLIITLCPAWEFNYKIYFEDYSHRTPFMLQSLRDIQVINGFDDVEVEFFRQLPSTWDPFLKYLAVPLSKITQILIPKFFKNKYKWVRFSKEIMLLSSSIKPKI